MWLLWIAGLFSREAGGPTGKSNDTMRGVEPARTGGEKQFGRRAGRGGDLRATRLTG